MPDLSLVAGPAALPLTVAEVKLHLNVQHSDHDTLIDTYLRAAVAMVDGRSGWLFRCLVTQDWAQSFDHGFPCRIVLPLGPVTEVISLAYVDSDGVTQTLDPSDYELFPGEGLDEAFVAPAWGASWPATRRCLRAVTVTYRAGSDPADVAPNIKVAVLFQVARLYRDREGGDVLDRTAECLLAPFRRMAV